jgi:polyferredoxin
VKKKKWPVIATVAIIGGLIALLFVTSRGNDKFRCEVCKTFDGRTVCSNGAATTQMEAQRIATEASCTMLTSGMNNLEQCRNSPARVTWK